MKKIITTILFALTACSFCIGETSNLDFSKISKHPRLFFKEGAEKKIADSLKIRPEMNYVSESIIETAKKFQKKSLLKRNQVGFRILHTSREAADRIMTWGYAYKLTGDKSFAESAKKELANLMTLQDWNPEHFLDVAEMAFAFAIGYDWFYDEFDEDFKKALAKNIQEKAFAPFYAEKHHWFNGKYVNNWNQVCSAGLLCAAISIYEEAPNECEKIINLMLKNIEKGLSQCYSKEGMYIEGYGYWGYGTHFQTYFNEALLSAFGTDCGLYEKYPNFLKSGKYIINMVGPSGKSFNFFDAGAKVGINPLLPFLAKKTDDFTLLFPQKKLYNKNLKNQKSGSSTVLALLYAYDTDFAKVLPPEDLTWSAVSSENPIFIARTSWVDNNALYLAVKGGAGTLSHAHLDASSFVFDALGERWAHDLGAQDYQSLEGKGLKIWGRFGDKDSERWRVWRYTNMTHNMLTVNDELINPKAKITIDKTYTEKNKLGAQLDTTKLYTPALKKSVRELSLIDSKILRSSDKIENGGAPSKIRWSICTFDTAKIIDDKTIEIESPNKKKMTLKLRSPGGFKAKLLSANSKNEWDTPNKNMVLAGFEGKLKTNEKCDLIVEFIPNK